MTRGGRVVTEREALIVATERRGEGADILEVYASVMIERDGPYYAPVKARLDSGCSSPGVHRFTEDPTMAFGEAIWSLYKVWDHCPGHSIKHECKVVVPQQMRTEEDCQITGQSVR